MSAKRTLPEVKVGSWWKERRGARRFQVGEWEPKWRYFHVYEDGHRSKRTWAEPVDFGMPDDPPHENGPDFMSWLVPSD